MNRSEICAGFSGVFSLLEEMEGDTIEPAARAKIRILIERQRGLFKTAIAAAVPRAKTLSQTQSLATLAELELGEILKSISCEIVDQLRICPVLEIKGDKLARIIINALSDTEFDGDVESYMDSAMEKVQLGMNSAADPETQIFIETLIRETLSLDALGFGADQEKAVSAIYSHRIIGTISKSPKNYIADAKPTDSSLAIKRNIAATVAQQKISQKGAHFTH